MAMTKKPCHGCREPQPFYRDAESVCDKCRELLEEAKARRAELEKTGDPEGREFVVMRSRDHEIDHCHEVPCIHKYHTVDNNDPRDRVFRKLYELARALATEAPKTDREDVVEVLPADEHGGRYYNSFYNITMLMPKGVPALINELHDRIRAWGAGCYAEGYREGSSILKQLSTGELTIDRFNELHVKRQKVGSIIEYVDTGAEDEEE